MSGRRTRHLKRAFRRLQDQVPSITEGRFRAFKRAWTRRAPFVMIGGLGFLRGKP